MTLRRIIRWINGPWRRERARREAQRMYDQLVIDMRETWRVVQTHRTPCYIDINRPSTFVGHITIVAETNELNERRVRCIECPNLFNPERSSQWSNYQIWAARAEPTRPPRIPMELPL